MKYCADCKHHRSYFKYTYNNRFASGGYYATECARTELLDIVTKQNTLPMLDCRAEREDALRLEGQRCGVNGKYWEAK